MNKKAQPSATNKKAQLSDLPIEKLDRYPMFAVQCDPKEHPYFKATVVQALTWLTTYVLGKKLLKDIHESIPQKCFSGGIKCIFVPKDIAYHPAGKLVKEAVEGCHPFTGAKLDEKDKKKLFVKDHPYAPNVIYCPDTLAVDAVDSSLTSNGQGSVCYMTFNNAFIVDTQGEKNEIFIVLAHELIHVLHNCTGTNHAGGDEEIKTVGLEPYTNEIYTENKFRALFKLPPREKY